MKRFLFSIILTLAISVVGWGQTNFTATYTFTGTTGDVTSFNYNGTTYAGITPGAMVKVGITSSSSTGNFRATNWPTGAISGSDVFTGSVDLGKYIGFTINAIAGYKFTVTSITFGVGRSATGTRQSQWRGSYDSYGSILTNYTTLAGGLTNSSGVLTNPDANSSWVGSVLTVGSNYVDIPTSAGFRIYLFNSEASGGTAGLQGPITIIGTYQAIAPPTWTSGWPKADGPSPSGFTARANISAIGTAYYVVLSSGAGAPSSAQVKAGQDATGTGVAGNMKGTISCPAATTEYTQAVSGLSSSTTYDVYFVAEDASANLQASPVMVTVATTSSSTAPLISDATVSAITNNSATLGGNVTSDGGSTVTGRGVVWSQTSLNSNPEIGGANVTNITGTGTTGVFTVPATSLPVATQISYKAYASNAIGTTYTSPVSTFYTLANEPTSHVGTFTANAFSPTQIDLTWTAATGADGYLIIRKQGSSAPTGTPTDGTSYSIGNAIGDGTLVADVLSGSTEAQSIMGLSTSTQYYFTIIPYAYDALNYQTYNYYTAATIPSATATTPAPPPTTYTWIGADNASWAVAGNWNPTRTSPAINDVLQFTNASTLTVTAVPAQTIGQLIVSGTGTKITLQAGGANTLTIGGGTGTDMDVAAGCELNISGSSALLITFSSGATASIAGGMTLSGGAHKLTSTTSNSIYFANGGIFTTGAGFTGNPFGNAAGNAGTVIFQLGSTYIYQAGSNPFALTQPASVVAFETGSLI